MSDGHPISKNPVSRQPEPPDSPSSGVAKAGSNPLRRVSTTVQNVVRSPLNGQKKDRSRPDVGLVIPPARPAGILTKRQCRVQPRGPLSVPCGCARNQTSGSNSVSRPESGRTTPKHIRQVAEGIDAVPLATGCHAKEHGQRATAKLFPNAWPAAHLKAHRRWLR